MRAALGIRWVARLWVPHVNRYAGTGGVVGFVGAEIVPYDSGGYKTDAVQLPHQSQRPGTGLLGRYLVLFDGPPSEERWASAMRRSNAAFDLSCGWIGLLENFQARKLRAEVRKCC
ncbi:hypothetical protein G7046_g8734 [Stylonectria norvegica]|nr:hypothetical protein G7046_g8734 [Stylonectria norvegica]